MRISLFRIAYWLTYGVAFLGIVASALRCYFGYMSVPQFKHPLCQVMNDDFDTFDTTAWTHEVQLDGFGNGEFEMTTDSSNNSYVKDGKLYLMPTLTSDVIGSDAIFDGHMYNLTDCTGANYTSCGLVSNRSTGAVIPPVMSARISTRLSHSIRFGRVEVVAKIPRGDWLWPAIWMLPTDPKYGAWPASGEIDVRALLWSTRAYADRLADHGGSRQRPVVP
jgi:beta-glucanase (GH16 family)